VAGQNGGIKWCIVENEKEAKEAVRKKE